MTGKNVSTQRRISEALFKLANKKNKKRRVEIEPIDEAFLRSSPVFRNPQIWIKRFRMIHETERIQSYKPLETSALAQILASPQRMCHGSRTVIPRDLMIPLRIMEIPEDLKPLSTPKVEEAALKKSRKKKNSKQVELQYLMTPIHPNDAKVAEDPVIYYPNSISLLETYLKPDSADTAPAHMFSFNPALYPNIKNIGSVAWNKGTSSVILKILEQNVIKSLNSLEHVDLSSHKFMIINSCNESEPISVDNEITTINSSKFSKEILNMLEQKFTNLKIPIIPSTADLVENLLKYTIYINN